MFLCILSSPVLFFVFACKFFYDNKRVCKHELLEAVTIWRLNQYLNSDDLTIFCFDDFDVPAVNAESVDEEVPIGLI